MKDLEEQIKRCEEWTKGKYVISCNQYKGEYCPMTCAYAFKIKKGYELVNENIQKRK